MIPSPGKYENILDEACKVEYCNLLLCKRGLGSVNGVNADGLIESGVSFKLCAASGSESRVLRRPVGYVLVSSNDV